MDLVPSCDSYEDGGDNYGVNNVLGMVTWRIRFPDGNIEAGIMFLLCNNFLLSFFCFVVVRSDHNERLVRINLPHNPITFGFELGIFGSIFLIFWL